MALEELEFNCDSLFNEEEMEKLRILIKHADKVRNLFELNQ